MADRAPNLSAQHGPRLARFDALLKAKLRILGKLCALGRAADNPDFLLADLLAKRIAVETEQFGGFDLVSPRRRERRRDQRSFHIAKHTIVEARRRKLIAVCAEIIR